MYLKKLKDIPLAGITTTILERRILTEQRLVPEGYKIGQTELRTALIRVSKNGYPEYPHFNPDDQTENERLHLDFGEWDGSGRPVESLVGTRDNHPSWYVEDHSGRRGVAPDRMDHYDGSQRFPAEQFGEGTEKDANGAPLHPEAKFIVENGAGVTSLAYNWWLAESGTADAIVLRVSDGKLEFYGIKKRADDRWGLPGESVDNDDPNLSESVNRAVHEEAGVPIEDVRTWNRLTDPVYDGVGADERDTLYSWRRAHGEVLFPNEEQIATIDAAETRDADEVAEKGWKTVDKKTLDTLVALHPEMIMAAVESVRVATGLVVDKEGNVGTPETSQK